MNTFYCCLQTQSSSSSLENKEQHDQQLHDIPVCIVLHMSYIGLFCLSSFRLVFGSFHI